MRLLEAALWILGITLIAFYVAANGWGHAGARHQVSGFSEANRFAPAPEATEPASSAEAVPTAAAAPADLETAVVAVLRIPENTLEVPVIYGTGENVLRRGAGVIEGTTMPGTHGNVALAAHRDTFFRGLKDIALGDQIELQTSNGTPRCGRIIPR